MKKYLIILFSALLLISCDKDNKVSTSGTFTINNILYGTGPYYAYGFSFTSADKVQTIPVTEQCITIGNDGTIDNLIIQTNSLSNSFYLYGEYTDEASAKQAFDKLTIGTVNGWEEWAFSVKPNQIWLFRTKNETYAKLRIISTVSEVREEKNYAECTFEWVYQPDGTLTFPAE
ncbi:MAG TPA: hypothetical protein PLR88_00705 [Bacteroidales bacterium]|nr:hypothetical protein [Bacteroidales bacterium]HPT20436.1 hypothetical protein [Bacteroidales bacterium]